MGSTPRKISMGPYGFYAHYGKMLTLKLGTNEPNWLFGFSVQDAGQVYLYLHSQASE